MIADDGFVVHVRLDAAGHEVRRAHGHREAEEERGAGADRHEGVHVGAAVAGGGPGAHVEMAAGPEHDRAG